MSDRLVSKIKVKVIWVKTKVLSDKLCSKFSKVFPLSPPLFNFQFITHDHYTPPIVLHVSVYEGEGPGVRVDAVLVALPRNPPAAHAPADAGLEVMLCSAPSVPQPVVQSRRRPLLGPSPG